MDRRSFLRSTALAVGVTALGPSFWRTAYAATAKPGTGPYGGLLAADANGVMLPSGFTSRILAVTGNVVGGDYVWHPAPDGGAVFPQDDGGWVYTSNSEVPTVGGVGALRFDRDGEVVDAYRILTGTSLNCAGGPTPWGTWLSCEETDRGRVWECEVGGPGQGVVLPALGTFKHEAVTFDDERGQLYLTEDTGTGAFYRFTPDAYPDLSSGALEVLAADAAGNVTWLPVLSQTEPQTVVGRPEGYTPFDGGEGVWFDTDHVYFTTKGDNRVWDLDVAQQRLAVLYDAEQVGEDAPLTGVDNLVVSQSADIFVAEDGGNLEIVMITPDGVVAPVVRLVGHDVSEICGPAFSPDGSRLYFSSQRGTDGRGVTFEVAGPFRTARTGPPARGSFPVPAGTGGTADGDLPTGGDAGPLDGQPDDTTSVQGTAARRLPATGPDRGAAAAAATIAAAGAAAAWAGRRRDDEPA
ncbi:MAG TPA: alkaline phosphatase PhoX [Mycobacteriales bacterium]|nr:alkaline phosphatase PhoX [Mycobacteriales bacterium]